MTERSNELKKWTLVDIQAMTGYSTTIGTYQALRRKGINPISYRKNPSGGGGVGEYSPSEVMRAMGERIETYQLTQKAAEK